MSGPDNLGAHRQTAVRLLLLAVAYVVAASVPDFGSFLNVIGATLVLFGGFTAPTIFHLKLVGRGDGGSWATFGYHFNCALVVMYSLVSVGCTYYAIVNW